MKGTLRINLDNPRFNSFRAQLPDLEAALLKFELDFYVIGAIAKDILLHGDGIATRLTKDLDLAIFVSSKKQFENLKDHLIDYLGYSPISDNSTGLQKETFQLDLIPFGRIEVLDGVLVEKDSTNVINGFVEVYESGLTMVEDSNNTFKIATPASIIILKLIAFDDRPEMRPNDPGDVACLINFYFELNKEEVWKKHSDLFNETDDLKVIASKVLGREISDTVKSNDDLKTRILNILSNHISKEDESTFVTGMVGEYCKSIDEALNWLKAIRRSLG